MSNTYKTTASTNMMTPSQQHPTSNSEIPYTTPPIFIPAPPQASSRYNRQLLIPSISLSGQSLISKSKVLIIGLGGLGSPASLYLAGAGIGTLGFCDGDVVELGNLHRQIVHRESSLGNKDNGNDNATTTTTTAGEEPMTKVASAIQGCKELNSEIEYIGHEVRLNGQNALEIIKEYDIILDCTDNPATRYLISDVCVVLGKILVSGAAQRLEGQLLVLNYPIYDNQEFREGTDAVNETIKDTIYNQNIQDNFSQQKSQTIPRGPCYRCIFPVPPAPEMVKGCNEIGILGPVVGTIGTLMASETLRIICRPRESRKPTMLLYNAWSVDPRGMFRSIGLRGRRRDCVSCGDYDVVVKEKGKVMMIDEKAIKSELMDYELFCGRVEDVDLLDDEKERVGADVFLEEIGKITTPIKGSNTVAVVVVDVREELEIELGSKISGSINIPLSKILRSGKTRTSSSDMNGTVNGNSKEEDELDDVLRRSEGGSVYFICQRGNDSQIAARKLMDRQKGMVVSNGVDEHGTQKRWIGDVKGGLLAIEKVAQR